MSAAFSIRPIAILGQYVKKRPTPKPLFRQGHHSILDSQSGRLQLLFHETIRVATLRFDGPAHAWMLTDHLISHQSQFALQALHGFIWNPLHAQGRSKQSCSVEEIALNFSAIY
jgi:hypothetical protein